MRFDFTSVLGLLQLLAIGLAVYLFALIWHTMRRLTRPPRRTYAHAIARGRPGDPGEALDGRSFESWTLRSRGLDLPVWDVKGDNPAGPIFIMLHGWGDGRVGALTRLGAIVPLASRILMPDLPGNGEATGTCSLGTRESDDLRALIERVREDARPLIVFGWSMGAGIAIQAGAEGAPIDAIIAEAPYRLAKTPARNVLRNANLPHTANLAPALALLGLRFGVGPRWRGFDRAALAGALSCPLLVVHGGDDEVCPLADAREITARASDATICEIERGRHNDLWTNEAHRERASAAIRAFVTP
ncbi:MAG: alpha/beta hydrolase [Phycisphaerales bacterium JB059]